MVVSNVNETMAATATANASFLEKLDEETGSFVTSCLSKITSERSSAIEWICGSKKKAVALRQSLTHVSGVAKVETNKCKRSKFDSTYKVTLTWE